jgi:hypothetical protein
MPKSNQDDAREKRITMEIVVDAYGPEEQWTRALSKPSKTGITG